MKSFDKFKIEREEASQSVKITGAKISVKDFFFLYLNGLIAALPFAVAALIIFLFYQFIVMMVR